MYTDVYIMDQLESQVAKIHIDSGKNASSYVYTLAEKAAGSQAELYAVIELPLFNPAAESACESICLAISSALKRVYKRADNNELFETAVAQINEELSKLVETGNTNWVNKINCILAVKHNADFSIATCGKVAAYLYRSEEFTDISCSPPKSNPLKTFENLAYGKLKLDDIIILSTTQLFNYLAIDRLKNLLQNHDFLTACQTVIETLKQNAGPEVAFGTILNAQVMPGQTPKAEIDLENYVVETSGEPLLARIWQFITTTINPGNLKIKRPSNIHLPQVSFAGSLTNIKKIMSRFSPDQVRGFSRTKKIFLISILVLLVAFILDLSIAAHYRKSKQTQGQVTTQLKNIQNLITQAQSSLLYKDTATAETDIQQAQSQMPKADSVSKSDQALYAQVSQQMSDLQQKLENTVTPQVTNLGSLGAGNTLLYLGNYLATQVNNTILSYNLSTNAIQDSALLSSQKITSAAYIKNTTAVVYDGNGLMVWDYAVRQFSPPFVSSVPKESSFVNLKYYPTNSRVYTIDKNSNQIISFAVAQSGASKPIISSKPGSDFSQALDFAIDGNIYILTPSGVNEYRSGSLVSFSMPTLFTPLSGKGKINTQIGWKNLYVLDSGNNRILVIDKKGNLVEILKSSNFTNLKDFVVDEPGKAIYVLNDSSLLKVVLP